MIFKRLNLYRKLYPGFLNFRFLKEIIYYLFKGVSRYPLSVNILSTSGCDFKCKICSYYGNSDRGSSQLSFKDIIFILDQVKGFKPCIFLGGGEPFLREDIYSVLEEIDKRGLKAIVSTNGYRLDLEKLSALKLDTLIISLYGFEEVHDEITGVSGSYSAVVEKIKKIAQSKIVKNLIVSTVLLPSNFKQLFQFSEYVLSLGADSIKIENLNYITDSERRISLDEAEGFVLKPRTLVLEEHCFSSKDLDSIYHDIKTLKRKYKNRVFLKPDLSKRDFLKWYSDDENIKRCHFIRHSIFISSCGDIIPCQFLRETELGKAARDSVEYIWHSKRYKDFRDLIGRSGLAVCKRCCK